MSQFSLEDRIRQWRNRQGNASSTPPEGDTDTDAGGVPSRRKEELDAAEALRMEMVDSRIPGDAEVSGAMAQAQLRKWWARINLRRRGLRIIGIPFLCVLFYGLLIAPAGKAVDSSFVILRAGESRDASQVAGLIGAGTGEGLTDAYRIREYLRSREAMLAMEQRHGFLAHFREGTWDPFSRPINLPALGLDPYQFYKRRIDIGIDVREGIVRLRVEAMTPADSRRFANGLLALARERTNAISDVLNADQIASLEEDVRRAEGDMREASEQLARAQRRQRELDPQMASTTTYQLIADLESTLVSRQAQRDSIVDNGMPESPLLTRMNAEIASIREQIDQTRARLTGEAGTSSLAEASMHLGPANTRLRLSQMRLEASLRTLEQANLNTIGQRRYLAVISNPVQPYDTWLDRLLKLLGLTLISTILAWGVAGVARSSGLLAPAR